MKILLVNKFLYPKGGAENYVFKLGNILEEKGHQVQYFGLEHEKNIVGNQRNAYVSYVDFQNKGIGNLLLPFRIIYSLEARQKIREVLEDFRPDVVHFNNIQFHLTPSMILEAENYRREKGSNLKIIYTAHDYQLICPSHGLFDNKIQVCEKCLDGNYINCFCKKCIKNSRAKSFLGTIDAYWWKYSNAYSYIDVIICPSEFLKRKLDIQERFRNKTVTIHNFVDKIEAAEREKKDYILEFGHLSKDKGTNTLLKVCRRMPNVRFLFAGYGESVEEISKLSNGEYVGFMTGKELERLISEALISVYPSEWYENCPFSVIESQMYQTPVVGSRMGGIPELIREGETGELFEAGNDIDLEKKIKKIISDQKIYQQYKNNCKNLNFETPETYYDKLMDLYRLGCQAEDEFCGL